MRQYFFIYIFLVTCFLSTFSCFSQNQVNGLVKDALTGEPVPFAVLLNRELNIAFTSGESGLFGFIPVTFPLELHVSSIGYFEAKVIINKSDTYITVLLEPEAINLNEVNVFAIRSGLQASSLESLRSAESYNLAGTTKDIFRSVQMLPGVSTNNAASARYNVRGGTYDENLMLINGIEVSEPYHIKIFPMASVGIFNIDLVQRIDFSAGGFSAEYGDALSSVLNVEYRKANNDSVTGRISLGMIDLGLVTDIPTGKKSSMIISARHSYLDPIVKIVQPDEKISLRYYDFQSKYDYELNPRNRISMFAIYSKDMDKVGPENDQQTSVTNGVFQDTALVITRNEQNSYFMDAKYDDILLAFTSRHIISGNFILNSEFSYYREKENIPQTDSELINFGYSNSELFNRIDRLQSEIQDYKIKNYEAKFSGKIRFNQNNNCKTGMYIRFSEFSYHNAITTSYYTFNNINSYPDTTENLEFPADIEYNSTQSFQAEAYKAGGYLTHLIQVNSKFAMNFGVRADYFNLNRRIDFSPRISLSFNLSPNLKAVAAWGIFCKAPLMKQLKYNYPTAHNTKSQKATHYLLGIEKKGINTTVKIESFYKKYDDLIPLRRTPMSRIIYDIKDNLAEGYAAGVDFQFVITRSIADIWFNYSIISAKERLKGSSDYYSRYTDQTHTISSLIMLKFRHQMEFGTKLTYGSGYTFQKKYFDPATNKWLAYNEIITDRLPYFLSLDIRFNKRFTFFSLPAQFYADVINCLNRKNSIGHIYDIKENQPYEENFEFYGIVPTFGIMIDF